MTTIVQPRADGAGVRPVLRRNGLDVLVRGRSRDESVSRGAMLAVGMLAALVYLWNLSVSGYANVYYSAAALAGAQSWSAWFFGSIDASNFITVDKPPLAVMLIGPVGADLRALVVEHPAAGGAARHRVRAAALLDRSARVRVRPRRHRGGRDGPHAGRGPHVPLQQSRRAADVPPHRRGVGALSDLSKRVAFAGSCSLPSSWAWRSTPSSCRPTSCCRHSC